GTGQGAGIKKDGNLTIEQSTVTGNSIAATPYTEQDPGPHPITDYSAGGAIYTTATAPLTMTNTIVQLNQVTVTTPYPGTDSFGGGLFLSGTSTISNSWIDQNYAGTYFGTGGLGYGAGIYNNDGNLTITQPS